jgi:hypothetical protein
MYFPYFRGKQFELILLRELAGFLKGKKIHPIIEPVRDNITGLLRTLDACEETASKQNLSVSANPHGTVR